MRLWKKAIAAMTAGVLCVGSVGMTGLQGVLESVGTVLSASAYVPSFFMTRFMVIYIIQQQMMVKLRFWDAMKMWYL